METLNDSPLLSEEANTAFKRVDALLLAHGIQHAAIRSAHCQRLLEAAIKSSDLGGPLEERVSCLLFEEINQGVENMHQAIEIEADPINRNRLLVAINRTNIIEENPEALLGLSTLNQEQARILSYVYKAQYVPELKRRSMGAPAIKFEGIAGVTGGTSQLFSSSPVFAKLAPVIGMLILFTTVYWFAR